MNIKIKKYEFYFNNYLQNESPNVVVKKILTTFPNFIYIQIIYTYLIYEVHF